MSGVHRNKKSGGRSKRLFLLACVGALLFNVTIGPLSANVSAASIEAYQEASASNSVTSTVVESTTKQFGLFIIDDIFNAIVGFFQALFNFLEGLGNLGACVAKFVAASPTSLPLALVGCPMIELTSGVMNGMQQIFSGLLTVSLFTADAGSGGMLEKATRAVVSIANIVFAIILLVIIAATAFGSGEGFGALSNYGIKKMLPKILVMAVAINTSFYICAALTDVFNLVGSGISGLTNTVIATANEDFLEDFSVREASWGNTNAANIVADVTATTGAAVAGISGVQSLVVVVLLMIVVLVIVMIIQIVICVTLMAVRNVVLVALVVVSPIAWVLGILPNTNKIFQKWFNLFGHMLMVYPAVMLLFSAAMLTANILQAGDMFAMFKIPMVLATMVSPLFFVKKIITSTSSVMSAVSKTIGGAVKAVAMIGAVAATGGMAAAAGGGSALLGAAKGAMSKLPGGDIANAGLDFAGSKAKKAGRTKGIGGFIAKNEADMAQHKATMNRSQETGEGYDEAARSIAAERSVARMPALTAVDAVTNRASGHNAETVEAVLKKGIKLDASEIGQMLEKLSVMNAADPGNAHIQAAMTIAAQQALDTGLYGSSQMNDFVAGGNNAGRGWSAEGRAAAICETFKEASPEKAANMSGDSRKELIASQNTCIRSATLARRTLGYEAQIHAGDIEVKIDASDSLKDKFNGASNKFH